MPRPRSASCAGQEFELRGGEMPKGMLLSGAPGTGKTFLAGCIAEEANLPFIYIDRARSRACSSA